MESINDFVVHSSVDTVPEVKNGLLESAVDLLDPKTRSIKKLLEEVKKNEIDSKAVETTEAALKATSKVIDMCLTHPRLSKDFKEKFEIVEGLVQKKNAPGFVTARVPEEMAKNYVDISAEEGADKNLIGEWMAESSLSNLITWTGIAMEANPSIVIDLNEKVDLSKYGVSAEIKTQKYGEKIKVEEGGRLQESLFSERMKEVSAEIFSKYGEEIANSILLCGGSARSLVVGDDPLDNYGGDVDYAIGIEVDKDTREGINAIFTSNCVGKPDDLTDPDLPFSQNMQKEGFVDIFDAIKKDPTFSIDKMAINIRTGEIFDPHNGLEDLRNGKLRIVGEDFENKLRKKSNTKEALVLAFRGARFGSQYGMEIDSDTELLFKGLMKKNTFVNRFHLFFRGLEDLPSFSEVGKTYLKLLEKTQHSTLIPKYLEKFGLLKQVSKSIDFANDTYRLIYGDRLRTIDELVWLKNYKDLAYEEQISYPQDGEGIRFSGEKTESINRPALESVARYTLALSRMLSYLLVGV